MSGGALNYFAFRFLDNEFSYDDSLEHFPKMLKHIPVDTKAHKDMLDLLDLIENDEVEQRAGLADRLAPLARSIEWYLSCDFSEKDVAEEVEKYEQKYNHFQWQVKQLTDKQLVQIADHFEVRMHTILRWQNGSATPAELVQKQVEEYLKENELLPTKSEF